MTPTERIAAALAIWPGREVDVATEAKVSMSRLRVWAGKGSGRYMVPTEEDAEKVETGVRALLQDCLAKLNGEEW